MKKQLLVIALLIVQAWPALADVTTKPIDSKLLSKSQNDEKENLLTDSYQRTLYVFDADQNKPTSVCNGECAEIWPPYIITAVEAKTLSAPLASVARADKRLQLTVNGRPVYTYALDRHVGDDQGDNVGNVWHYIEIK